MADKEEVKGTDGRGADWEVVSLTASTYAAAPGPGKVESNSGVVDTDRSETSNALFMSGHFVFPPSQHENLPLESENTEGEDYVEESGIEEGEKSWAKDDDNLSVGKLAETGDFHGISFFDEKGSLRGLDLGGKEENVYDPMMGESNIDDEDRVLAETTIGSSDLSAGSSFPKRTEEDKYDGPGLPYAEWWKKHAAALYARAKETNSIWSIFIAAAVMGLVIIGQQWQQERWQVLHHKWHSGVYDEKVGRMVGPISRLKDALVGGNRRGFSIRPRDD